MGATASPIPAVFQAGLTQDMGWQPLGQIGVENPAFYTQFFDEFLMAHSFAGTGFWGNVTGTSATWATTAGQGGQGKLSTEAVINQIAEVQGNVVAFTQNIAPKKLAMEARISTWVGATSKFIIGLCNAGAAFTAATGAVSVTDGVYLLGSLTGGVLSLSINQAVGSVITSAALPVGSGPSLLVPAQTDLGFYQDRNGDIQAYVDTSLVGYIPQSLLGTAGNPQSTGSLARILGSAYTATAVALTPTLALWTGSAAATTMTFDFVTVMQER